MTNQPMSQQQFDQLVREANRIMGGLPFEQYRADATVETDRGADIHAEAPDRERTLKPLFDAAGVDPRQDPIAAARGLKGEQAIRRAFLDAGISAAQVAYLMGDGDFAKKVQHRAQGFDAYVQAYGSQVDPNQVLDSLLNYQASEVTGVGRRPEGLIFGDHGLAALQLVQGAESTLDMSLFQLEQPTLLAAIQSRTSDPRKPQINVHTFKPITSVGAVTDRALDGMKGINRSTSPMVGDVQLTDHAKFIARDLHDPNRAAFMISSANATMGAMGRMVSRSGDTLMSQPGNLEIGMVFHAGMAGLAEGVFERMRQEAQAVMPWMRGETPLDAQGRPKQLEGHRHLLSNRDLKEQVLSMFDRASGADDVIQIMSDSLEPFSQEDGALRHLVERMKRDGHQGRVRILIGQGHSADKAYRAMQDFQDQIERLGLSDRIEIREYDGVLHSKAVFARIGGRVEQVVGSMRLGGGMWHWETGTKRLKEELDEYGNQRYRDLGTYLTSEDYLPLATLFDPGSQLDRIFRSSRKFGDRFVPYYANEHGIEDIQNGIINALLARQVSAANVERTDLGIRITIGGSVRIGNEIVNAGSLFTFSAVDSRVGFGPGHYGQDGSDRNTFYLPEFSKFVSGAFGSDGGFYNRYEVLSAAVDASQSYFEDHLRRMVKVHGAKEIQRRLMDPFERGILRQQVRMYGRSRFENFAGLEPGAPAYQSKDFAHLLMPVVDGRLDMRANLDVTAQDFELATSEMARALNPGAKVKHPGLALFDRAVGYMAGGLSKFARKSGGQTSYSSARLYDMYPLVDSLPSAARVKRKRNGEVVEEMLFLLPANKFAQLPQRIQTQLASRDMGVDFVDTVEQGGVADYSRLTGRDGKIRRGIRYRGYVIPGLDGNNAYVIADEMRNADGTSLMLDVDYFKSAVLPQDAITGSQAILEEVVRNLKDHEGRSLVTDLGDGRVRISHEGLRQLGHQLPMAESFLGLGAAINEHGLGLTTENWDAARPELILDFNRIGTRRDPRTGKTTRYIVAKLLRHQQSGDRTTLGAKNPEVYITRQSDLVHAVEAEMRSRGSATYEALGLDRANIIFGSGNIKTANVMLETGLHVIESGLYRTLLNESTRGSLRDIVGAFTEKFAEYLDADEEGDGVEVRKLLESISSRETSDREIIKLLDKTFKVLERNKTVKSSQLKHMASAFIAFSLMADYELKRASSVDRSVGGTPLSYNLSSLKEHGAIDILGALPASFVSALSASAVTMSSRGRVNLLSYHSGEYADALMNLMALSPEVTQRNAAIRELVGTGILGLGGWSHQKNQIDTRVHNALTDFEVSAHALPGLEKEFGMLSRVMNDLKQAKGEDVARLDAEATEIRNQIAAKLADPNFRVRTKGKGGISASIQAVIKAQEEAGMGSRTVFMPTYDEKGNYTGTRAINFVSASTLRAMGTYDDYSHDIQRTQVRIEQLLHIFATDGKPLGARSEAYDELMNLAGQLQALQRDAMATSLQQFLGGKLAITGYNMVAGNLPDLEAGTMVLGDHAFEKLKAQTRNELLRALDEASRNRFGLELGELIRQGRNEEVKQLISDLHDGAGISEEVSRRLTAFMNARRISVMGGNAKAIESLRETLDNALYTDAMLEGILDHEQAELERLHADIAAEAQLVEHRQGEIDDLKRRKTTLFFKGKLKRGQVIADARKRASGFVAEARSARKKRNDANKALNRMFGILEVGEELDREAPYTRDEAKSFTVERLKTELARLRTLVRTDSAAIIDEALNSLIFMEEDLKKQLSGEELFDLKLNALDQYIDKLDNSKVLLDSLISSIHEGGQAEAARVWESTMAGIRELSAEMKVIGEDIRESRRFLRQADEHVVGKHVLIGRYLRSRKSAKAVADRARAELASLESGDGGIVDLLDTLLEDQAFRMAYMKGIFQRAGSPMGPFAITVQKIIRTSEYKGIVQLHEPSNQMSVFVSSGTMMHNLGDFDGDTTSVALLAEYARLEALERMRGWSQDDTDLDARKARLRYREAKRQLAFAPKEISIRMARSYTGDVQSLSDEALYLDEQARQEGKTVSQQIAYLHDLRRQRLNGAVLGEIDQLRLQAFEGRIDALYNLAGAAVKFTDDLLATQKRAALHTRNMMASGMSEMDAYAHYYTSGAGKKDVAKALGKMRQQVSEATIINERVLAGIFAATNFAAGALIGKGFEMTYTAQMETEARHRHRLLGLADAVREDFGLTDKSEAEVMDFIKSSAETPDADPRLVAYNEQLRMIHEARHRELGGYLAIQQIARDAIKPKGVDAIKELSRYMVGGEDGQDTFAGIEYVKNSIAVKGLDVIYELVNDTSLFGDQYREGYAESVEGLERANEVLGKALFEFYGGSGWVESLYAAGRTREDVMKQAGMLREGGVAVFSQAEIEEFYRQYDAGKYSGQDERQALERYLRLVAMERAYDLITENYDAEIGTQRALQKSYMKAINAESADARETISGTMTSLDKVKLFSNLVDRGQILNASGMQWALEDIFNSYESREQLEEDIRSSTNFEDRSSTLGDLYDAYTRTNDIKSAMEMARRSSADPDTLEGRKRYRDQARELSKLLGIDYSGNEGTLAGRINNILTGTKAGEVVTRSMTDVFIPGLLMGGALASGLGYGGFGGGIGEAMGQSVGTAAALSASAQGGLAMAGMATMGAQDDVERVARAGIFGLSMLAGIGSDYLVQRAALGAGIHGSAMGVRLGASLVSTILGTFVGLGAEAAAIGFGWLRPRRADFSMAQDPMSGSRRAEELVAEHADEVDEALRIVTYRVYDEEGNPVGIYELPEGAEGQSPVPDETVRMTTLDDYLEDEGVSAGLYDDVQTV